MKKSTQYELGPLFLPAPFVRKTIISLDSKDPAEAIIAVKKSVNDLKTEYGEEDSEFAEEVEDHAR